MCGSKYSRDIFLKIYFHSCPSSNKSQTIQKNKQKTDLTYSRQHYLWSACLNVELLGTTHREHSVLKLVHSFDKSSGLLLWAPRQCKAIWDELYPGHKEIIRAGQLHFFTEQGELKKKKADLFLNSLHNQPTFNP